MESAARGRRPTSWRDDPVRAAANAWYAGADFAVAPARPAWRGAGMASVRPDDVKRQVAAHWNRRAAHFDDDFGHSIRTPAERAAWDRILDLVLAGRRQQDALD